MNKFLKKLTCALLTIVMIAGVTVGCDKGVKEVASTTDVVTTTEAAAAEVVDVFDITKATEMNLKLWWAHGTDLTPDDSPKGADNLVQSWLTEKTKVNIATEDIQGNAGQNWLGKLTMLAAGGDLPDVAVNGGAGVEIISKLLEGDKVWELTPELLQKYAPNIWSKTNETMWKNTTVDGKIYGIPFFYETSKDLDPNIDERYLYGKGVPGTNKGSHWDGYGIRDDISKQLFPDSKSYDELVTYVKSKGDQASAADVLDLPLKTKDDVVKMFYDIQKLELKENGKEVYSFAYPGGDTWAVFSQLMPNFMGNWELYQFTHFDLNTQKIVFDLQLPIYKEFAGIINKMVRDKVCEPESLLQTSAQYTEKVLDGRYAVIHFGKSGKDMDTLNIELANAGKTYRYRPFVTQVPVSSEVTPYKAPSGCGGSIMILKSDGVKTEKELAQILNYYDIQYTDEFGELFFWGPKDAGLYTEADGKRQFVDEKLNRVLIEGVQDDTVTKLYKKGLGERDPYRQIFLYKDCFSVFKYNIINKSFIPSLPNVLGRVLPGSQYEIKAIGPAKDPWDSAFAEVPGAADIVNGWQEKYDNAFKETFVANSDEQFNELWDSAQETLSTVATPDVLNQMTEIAKQQYEVIMSENQ